ncbi:hypothetical protein CEUSTIGMA_g2796.t1 [Chlamydomonas eustigma]|uniref:Aminotransferase class V domain-containing protein n=1 Tax=Chlamydomonas eustigma TaxID=1157962 RepID=A0A250WXK3_9CHLO|nr:hypothetical protein CEUSTIGMA_g2796.t1 [Chlamydomonas eustigma]|eukprot:GAX75352.1 hypothetical protein CEUSTIGMA_g2796.t1 [Chlamydomonas eustigma]
MHLLAKTFVKTGHLRIREDSIRSNKTLFHDRAVTNKSVIPLRATCFSAIGTPLPHIEQAACIYLDYNGTTPIFPEVAEAMRPFLVQHGNPSSSHKFGRECNMAVQKARQQVASLINCHPHEVYFTSCGTESDNWAIVGTVMAARRRSNAPSFMAHVVTSQVEHPAVLECLKHLQQQGLATYTAIPVDHTGTVDPLEVEAAIISSTVLVTIMHSNNEVGTIQPISEVAAVVKGLRGDSNGDLNRQQQGTGSSILFHTDAAQSLGKVQVDVRALDVDMATIVGHKFGAPKGVAALYIRDGVEISSFFLGGGQEGGRRAGTENVLLLAGFGRAAELAVQEREALTEHMQRLRDDLQDQLCRALPQEAYLVNGPSSPSQRLPNTLSISIKGLDSPRLLAVLADELAATAGAACHVPGYTHISSVLAAMDVPVEYAAGTLRLSVGRHTTQEEVDAAVGLILREIAAQGLPLRLPSLTA